MELLETITMGRYEVEVCPDVDAISPREFSNLGTIVCFHRRRNFANEANMTPEEADAFAARKDVIALPIFMFEHSGIVLKTSDASFKAQDPDRYDWGRLGWIWVTKEDVWAEYQCQRISPQLRERVLDVLRKEVEIYSDYVDGAVFAYVLKMDGNQISSCGGYYGFDHQKSGLLEGAIESIRHCDPDFKPPVQPEAASV